MPWVDLDVVGELEERLERSVQLASAAFEFGAITGNEGKVDAADVPHEESVSGKDEPIVNQEAHVLGSVTGRVDHPDVTVADLDEVTVREGLEVEPHGGAGSHPQTCTRPIGELESSGAMVGVDVSVDDVRDPEAVSLCDGDVIGWLPLGIDYRSDAPTGAADQVRGAGPLLVKELPKDHCSPAFP